MISKLSWMLTVMILTGCGFGSDFVTSSGVCEGYGDPADSLFAAPWPTNIDRTTGQTNCGTLSHFGDARFSYDILMGIGSPIVAARAGTVVQVETTLKDGNGCPNANRVFIQHEDGSVGRYFHFTLNGPTVVLGQDVQQGDVIGSSGNTGCSTTPHLHFDVVKKLGSEKTLPVTFSNIPSAPRGLRPSTVYTPTGLATAQSAH